ncbi:hypothetical protein GQ55_7G185100 [Panicum hallii var. hallii]|uniref:Uncharacterized protein n=1 Tax=Panicum hallii var. hallii TaxID=1504633 RepID=A0A2T7CWE2_9POAL|nr:hypothetical protein GQ55_7G185100 [Panicum hallii var. hallii]
MAPARQCAEQRTQQQRGADGSLLAEGPPRNELLCPGTLLGYVFGRSAAPPPVVPRRKRSNEKAAPHPDARAHEAGSRSASATGDGYVRLLLWLRGLTSTSSEGCVPSSPRHQGVRPREVDSHGGTGEIHNRGLKLGVPNIRV